MGKPVDAPRPSRAWPVMIATVLGPVSVGLALHALIQIDRWMLLAAIATTGVSLIVGSIPVAARGAPDGPATPQLPRWGRRSFLVFAVLATAALVTWRLTPLRIGLGITAVGFGFAYLVILGRNESAASGSRRGAIGTLIPWCYAFGPAGALALAALAMRPLHLGAWRDPVYLGMGRVAAVAAFVFWLALEIDLARRFRRRGLDIPGNLLPFRLLTFLLAVTGILVPGGGSPYAISWVIAWFIAAAFERRLALGHLSGVSRGGASRDGTDPDRPPVRTTA